MRLLLIVVTSSRATRGVIGSLLLIKTQGEAPLGLKVEYSRETRWLFPFSGTEQRQNVLK